MGEFVRKIKISFNYYRSFAPFNVAITLLCAFVLYQARSTETLSMLILIKAAGIALSFFLAKILRPQELYYYRNLEIPQAMVWAVAAISDFFLFGAIITLTYLLFL